MGPAHMTDEWRHLSDEKLARLAQDGLQGQGATVEAMEIKSTRFSVNLLRPLTAGHEYMLLLGYNIFHRHNRLLFW